jgi:hypothetical protein
MAKKFFKTIVTFEVLSDEPIPYDVSLDDIVEEAREGRYVGRMGARKEVPLTGFGMARALEDFGSDPSFFELDDEGNHSEEE